MKANPDPSDKDRTPVPPLLYLHALGVLVLVRLGLTFLNYRRVERLLPSPASKKDSRFTPWQIAWSVKRMCIYVPFASCLTQALSLQYLLGRRGESSSMCVGVSPTEAGRYEAHAWLLWNDQIIIGGGKNLEKFSIIARLEAGAS